MEFQVNEEKMLKEIVNKRKIKFCKNCNCITKTKQGTQYICGKCGNDRRGEEK